MTSSTKPEVHEISNATRGGPSYVIIIIIIMWLVQWTLPFLRATSMPVNFVLDNRQLSDQCLVERHRIQLCGAEFDEVGLICGSSPLVIGSHWI